MKKKILVVLFVILILRCELRNSAQSDEFHQRARGAVLVEKLLYIQ